MNKKAFEKYKNESSNWLNKSRCDLMYELIIKYVGKRSNFSILEIGAGVGQNTTILKNFGIVDVVEINEEGIKVLKEIKGINRIFTGAIPFELEKSYDLIIMMDVLEHIEDDRKALKWIYEKLNFGGYLLITVPAYQFLFSEHDVAVHHFRRYKTDSLTEKFPEGLKACRIGYYNSTLFPIVALFRILKKMRYKMFFKKFKFEASKDSSDVSAPIEKVFRRILLFEIKKIVQGFSFPFGLSIYCISKK